MGGWRYTTVNCERIWRWYPRVGRALRPVYGPCVKAAALALPLLIGPAMPSSAYPGMGGFPTPGATESYAPAFGGLSGLIGAWFPQAVGSTPPFAAVSAGPSPAEVGSPLVLLGPIAGSGSLPTPVNTSPTVETAGHGAAERPVSTPEPSSLELMTTALAAWLIGLAWRNMRRVVR